MPENIGFFDDDYEDIGEEEEFDCGMDRNGDCGYAGSEECDFECPSRMMQIEKERRVKRPAERKGCRE